MTRPALRLAQISDTHLYRDPARELMGLNTQISLDAVVERMKQTFWPLDAVLLTGDLVHDASPEGYARLRQQMAALGVAVYCLPGNHDHPATLAEILNSGSVHTTRSASLGDWSLVLLDSTLPGEDSGVLSQHELHGLDAALAANPERNALVCLHHQPVPVDSGFMDSMALLNHDAFFTVLDRHPQVRGVLWGHVHQAFAARRGTIELYGCPSSCVQFKPGAERFALDDQPPGFRWLELHADGRIETGIIRLEACSGEVDASSGDY
jgi:3',5'-cyclic-AMP phosphodiesterase